MQCNEEWCLEMARELGIQSDALAGFFVGGAFAALVTLGVLLAFLVVAAIYIYFALAYKTIAEKLKFKKSWIAWIPVAQWAMLLHLGGFHWAWIFLILIPVLGWGVLFVLMIIAMWRVFAKVGQPGWFSLSTLIPEIGFILYAIAVGLAAWQDKPVKTAARKTKKKKTLIKI